MRLKIVTPSRVVFDEEVEAIRATAVDGEFGVLPNHIPMVTPLNIGVLQFTPTGGAERTAAVMGGLFRTDGKTASILSDAAELDSEIDATRAKHAMERAEARVREKNADVDLKRAEMAMARAITRLKLSKLR
jgi:F-type H+-transporting ATPase subunit epsilon